MKICSILVVALLFHALPILAGRDLPVEPALKKRKLRHSAELAEFQEAIQNAIEIVGNPQPLEIVQAQIITPWTLEEQNIIQEALEGVDGLTGHSFEVSFPIHTDFDLEFTIDSVESNSQISFLAPLISTLVHYLRSRGIVLSHFSMRVDPDTRNMFTKKKGTQSNRRTTHAWHHHDTHSYLFVLSTAREVATQVREEDGQEHSIPLLELFFLDGLMEHRTPPQSNEHHKRIHFSFGVFPEEG